MTANSAVQSGTSWRAPGFHHACFAEAVPGPGPTVDTHNVPDLDEVLMGENELIWQEAELLKNISTTTVRFSLAQHVLTRTEQSLRTQDHQYSPLAIPHSSPEYFLDTFGLTSLQCKLLLFAVGRAETQLGDITWVRHQLKTHSTLKSEGWKRISQLQFTDPVTPFPPG